MLAYDDDDDVTRVRDTRYEFVISQFYQMFDNFLLQKECLCWCGENL